MSANFFLVLYPFVSLINMAAYLPQIKKLLQTNSLDGVSLSAWMSWLFGSVVTLGYGIYYLNDFLFLATQALNAIMVFTIISIIFYKQFQISKTSVRV